jgi:predicted DCC family thiol-disulfide oxidoreductase YuxK
MAAICLIDSRPDAYRMRPALDPSPPTDATMTTTLPEPRPGWPTSVTVFFDGGNRRLRLIAAHYRRACHGRRDIRWRDLRDCPHALRLFGIGQEHPRRLFVVDRAARLRVGLDALIKLWAELPGWRMLATVLTVTGVKALVARPLTPRRRSPA